MHRKHENASGSPAVPSSLRETVEFSSARLHSWELPDLHCTHLCGRIQSTDVESIPLLDRPLLCILRRGEAVLDGEQPSAIHHLREQTLNLILPGTKPLHWRMEAQEIDLMCIGWTEEAFAKILTEMEPLWQHLQVAMAEKSPACLFPEAFSYGLQVHTTAHDLIRHLSSPQPQAALHLRAGAASLLAHLADEAQARTLPQAAYIRSDYDHERLHFARAYLMQHMAMPPSLPDLARIAGINEFKLKRGFKELFGQPVFAYLAAARLEKARELLQSTRMTATEIAFELGYASLQHFSSAFKQRYGVTPTAFRTVG